MFLPRLTPILVAALVALAAAPSARAQTREYLGPGKCTDCHDHKDEKEWSEKRDGDGKGKQHINALNQLGDPKAADYGKALGIADIYDAKSTCVKCHATVVRGSPDFGISCESCHGAGKDYLKPHQEKGAYATAVSLGMRDIWKKPENWAKECLTCHMLGNNPGDTALIAAGHSSGKDFLLGNKFTPVAGHWTTSKYTANQIAAAGQPTRDELLKKQGGAAKPAAAPAPAPAPEAPAAAAPPVAPPVSPPQAAALPPPAPQTPRPATPQAVGRALPPPPVAPPPPANPTEIVVPPLEPEQPQTAAGMVSSIQGRLAALLDALLSKGVTAPQRVVPPERKTVYRGADADLLRLQEEVIGLALEALGVAPPAKKAAPQQ